MRTGDKDTAKTWSWVSGYLSTLHQGCRFSPVPSLIPLSEVRSALPRLRTPQRSSTGLPQLTAPHCRVSCQQGEGCEPTRTRPKSAKAISRSLGASTQAHPPADASVTDSTEQGVWMALGLGDGVSTCVNLSSPPHVSWSCGWEENKSGYGEAEGLFLQGQQ